MYCSFSFGVIYSFTSFAKGDNLETYTQTGKAAGFP